MDIARCRMARCDFGLDLDWQAVRIEGRWCAQRAGIGAVFHRRRKRAREINFVFSKFIVEESQEVVLSIWR